MNSTTKENILEIAHKLFADKGFTGVSVREIAKECGCNIAAINYHFSNKKNLYLQTIHQSIERSEKRIEDIYNSLEFKNVNDLTSQVFDSFIKNNEDLRTAFKTILSNTKISMKLPDFERSYKGPPGGEYFSLCFKEQFPAANDKDIDWAVRCIFSQVIHKALIACNSDLCAQMLEVEDPTSMMKEDILRLIPLLEKELSS